MRRLVPVIYAIVFLDAVLQFALVPLLPDYADELARWLGQLYNRDVSEADTVTVIRFSQIIGTMF